MFKLMARQALAATPQIITELKQPRQQLQQCAKFTYLTMKYNSVAFFARAFFIFVHVADVLVLSMTWKDLFWWSCVDNMSIIWWQYRSNLSSYLKHCFQFNSMIFRLHFSGIMTWNIVIEKIITEMQSYILRWGSGCHQCHPGLSSL